MSIYLENYYQIWSRFYIAAVQLGMLTQKPPTLTTDPIINNIFLK